LTETNVRLALEEQGSFLMQQIMGVDATDKDICPVLGVSQRDDVNNVTASGSVKVDDASYLSRVIRDTRKLVCTRILVADPRLGIDGVI
jgi:hypothetical protein